jgi:hypothetical protein
MKRENIMLAVGLVIVMVLLIAVTEGSTSAQTTDTGRYELHLLAPMADYTSTSNSTTFFAFLVFDPETGATVAWEFGDEVPVSVHSAMGAIQ